MNAIESIGSRQTAILIVPGMGSDHCAGLVSQSLKRLPGITELSTSIASHKVRIEFDAEQTSLAALKQGTFGIVQGGTGAAEAAADLLAQLFRLLTGQAGRVLQQLLGVANQCLKLFQ